ncbi:MAG: hypothetical protein AAF621_07185 [Pseudomonadota bacterium]
MNTVIQRTVFGVSLILVVVIAAVFLFLATALVPYWQSMSGTEVQEWFAGPFNYFSYMMVPIHFLSIPVLVTAYVFHRKSRLSSLFLLALTGLLFCQAFNFILYGGILNPALQSQVLSDTEALATLDQWAFYNDIRIMGVIVSILALMAIMVKANGPFENNQKLAKSASLFE